MPDVNIPDVNISDVSFPDIAALAGPIYIIFMIFEYIMIRRGAKGKYTGKDTANSITLGIGMTVSGLLFASTIGAATYALMMWVYQFRLFDMGFSIWAFALVFVLDDFRYYWTHRWAHKVRWYWADHVVHHSSTHYNLSTALRQPWFTFLKLIIWTKFPLILLGFHPAFVTFAFGINLFYQFFIHTQAIDKMPRWFEYIFNTPSHHRVHHGRNPRYLDANFAGVFIIWDRIFGSFVPEQDEELDYGLVVNVGSENPFYTAVHEYINLVKDQWRWDLTFMQRLKYLFMPPGYAHDGSRMGSKQLKEKYVRENPTENGKPGLPFLDDLASIDAADVSNDPTADHHQSRYTPQNNNSAK